MNTRLVMRVSTILAVLIVVTGAAILCLAMAKAITAARVNTNLGYMYQIAKAIELFHNKFHVLPSCDSRVSFSSERVGWRVALEGFDLTSKAPKDWSANDLQRATTSLGMFRGTLGDDRLTKFVVISDTTTAFPRDGRRISLDAVQKNPSNVALVFELTASELLWRDTIDRDLRDVEDLGHVNTHILFGDGTIVRVMRRLTTREIQALSNVRENVGKSREQLEEEGTLLIVRRCTESVLSGKTWPKAGF